MKYSKEEIKKFPHLRYLGKKCANCGHETVPGYDYIIDKPNYKRFGKFMSPIVWVHEGEMGDSTGQHCYPMHGGRKCNCRKPEPAKFINIKVI